MIYIITVVTGIYIIKNSHILSEYNDNCLDPHLTTREKGIAAILIILHHLSQRVTVFGILSLMNYVGFILVSVFFFLSGYGLMFGVLYKPNYLDNFFKKRVMTIMIPYWIVNSFKILFDMIYGIKHNIFDYILSYLGIDVITGTWFVTSILIFYLLFFVAFKFFKKNQYAVLMLFLEILFYCAVCSLLNLHTSYTASVSAFILGIIWHYIGNRFALFVRNHYMKKLFAFVGIFIFLFMSRLCLMYMGYEYGVLHIFLRNLISVLFILNVIVIMQKVQLSKGIFDWLGGISYELYIVHFVLLDMLEIVGLRENEFVVTVVVLSLLMASILHFFDEKIIYNNKRT